MEDEPRIRLRQALVARKVSQREFAKLLDTSEQYVSNIMSGSKPLTDKFAAKAARELKVDFEWLRAGVGSMELTPDSMEDVGYMTARLIDVPPTDTRRILALTIAKMTDEQAEALDQLLSAYTEQKKKAGE